jgi:hypothetical protein
MKKYVFISILLIISVPGIAQLELGTDAIKFGSDNIRISRNLSTLFEPNLLIENTEAFFLPGNITFNTQGNYFFSKNGLTIMGITNNMSGTGNAPVGVNEYGNLTRGIHGYYNVISADFAINSITPIDVFPTEPPHLISGSSSKSLVAAVHLPDGIVLDSIKFIYIDDYDGLELQMGLYKMPTDGSTTETTIIQHTSSGDIAPPNGNTVNLDLNDHLIDNKHFAYYIRIKPLNTWPSGADLAFRLAQIKY